MVIYELQKDMEGTELKAGDMYIILNETAYYLVRSLYEHEFIEQNPRLFKIKENENNSIGLHS